MGKTSEITADEYAHSARVSFNGQTAYIRFDDGDVSGPFDMRKGGERSLFYADLSAALDVEAVLLPPIVRAALPGFPG